MSLKTRRMTSLSSTTSTVRPEPGAWPAFNRASSPAPAALPSRVAVVNRLDVAEISTAHRAFVDQEVERSPTTLAIQAKLPRQRGRRLAATGFVQQELAHPALVVLPGLSPDHSAPTREPR